MTPSSKKNRIPEEASASTSERERHTLTGSPRDELDVDKSNIPSTSFSSGGRNSGIPGSRPFKRLLQAVNNGADEDEQTEHWAFNKRTRTKTVYGAGRGIDSIRGSQAVTDEQTRKKTNGEGRCKPKARENEGLLLQYKSVGTVATMEDPS